MRQPCFPCQHHASRSSKHHRTEDAATPSLRQAPHDYFSRRTPLNFLALFLTAMNWPPFLLRLVDVLVSGFFNCVRFFTAPLRALSPGGFIYGHWCLQKNIKFRILSFVPRGLFQDEVRQGNWRALHSEQVGLQPQPGQRHGGTGRLSPEIACGDASNRCPPRVKSGRQSGGHFRSNLIDSELASAWLRSFPLKCAATHARPLSVH
jgi:hypothetical protein